MEKTQEIPIEKDFAQVFTRLGKIFGLSDLSLGVIATLYITPREISMEDVAEKTGYSLSSVSGTVKNLSNFGMIQKTKRPGSKKIYLSMEKDLVEINLKKMNGVKDNLITPVKRKVTDIIDTYEKSKDKETIERLKIVKTYVSQVKRMETLVDRWKKDLENVKNEKRNNNRT